MRGAARSDLNYRNAADLLRAHALARMKNVDGARTVLDAVQTDADASHFDRARATFIRVTTELVRRGLPTPEERCVEIVAPGRAARWRNRSGSAASSAGSNGSRSRRICVTGGVSSSTSMMSRTMCPRAVKFSMPQRSSPSRKCSGKVGVAAFTPGRSALFLICFATQLLFERGGLWTDTDVINFRLYEPDGRKFVCTEISDAGLVTLNGAIMAAPAGDAMMERAYQRASALLGAKDKMFFTRVGPYLLAELALEFGVELT